MKKIMIVFGTRPEAIKMCPLVNELKLRKSIKTSVCVTAQHREMLDQVLTAFSIKPDYDLNIMKQGQTLADITTRALNGLEEVIKEVKVEVPVEKIVYRDKDNNDLNVDMFTKEEYIIMSEILKRVKKDMIK